MPKEKISLNSIYISDRLQKSLQPVSNSALTAITAPMGYGKTTAVNWYLSRLAKDSQALLIRISIYSQNLSIFWKSVQNAFSFAGLNFLDYYDCPEDEASAGFLTEILCYQLEKCENSYFFIDDFHLLKDDRAATFLCRMAGRIPENVHLIVASRNHFISDDWIVRLGGRLHRIEIDDLRLNAGELSAYIRRCGTSLTDSQLEQLLKSSEGWFAAVYLNLCSFSKSGELPGKTSDIYQMFSASMLNPLPEDRKEFLSAMGLADEFTEEMAEFITKREDVHQILKTLTRQNAFVTCLNDGQTYRFHHMMKECAFRAFRTLDDSRQAFYYERYGAWYEKYGAYIHALSAYRRNQNFAAILRVVQKDAGILLASLKPEEVLEVLNRCPVSVLKEYPLAILVLMRCMFNWKNIPKMLELKELLLASIREHPKQSEEERGNLLGECDLIQSFLMYNDISRMSQFHRSASEKMTRPAISIRKTGSWTFGSPSVLMMFHCKSGTLDAELAASTSAGGTKSAEEMIAEAEAVAAAKGEKLTSVDIAKIKAKAKVAAQNAQKQNEEVDVNSLRKELGIKKHLFGYSTDELQRKANGEKVFPHVFGTDMYGRDILVRVMYGARVSMSVGICAAFLVLVIGALYGAYYGYCGGKVDAVMQRIVELIYAVPEMLVVLLIATALKPILTDYVNSSGTSPMKSFVNVLGPNLISMFIAFGLLYWVTMSRIIRGQVLQLKQQEYVTAARALGASGGRIIRRHLLPNCIGQIVVTTCLQIPSAIFLESFLSYLGVGVSAPLPSLGSMATDALSGMYTYTYRLIVPSVILSIMILAFNLFGD